MATEQTPPMENASDFAFPTTVIIETPRITITGPASFNAPDAAQILEGLPEDQRLAEIRRFLEVGAQAIETVRTNTTLRLVEAQIGGLYDGLAVNLTELLKNDRAITLKDVRELLENDRGKVTQFMAKYLDPESQASLPAAMGKLFDRATTEFYKQAEALLAADGDESALGKLATRFSKELDKATGMVLEQIAARHALTTRSNLAGRPFEDALEERLIAITRPLGDTVERTGDTMGELRRKWGDMVITINRDTLRGHDGRLTIEAKKRAETDDGFKASTIRDQLLQARRNRNAQAELFVVNSACLLPLGLAFHEIDSTSLAVAYEPGGDDLGLTVAIRVLRAAIVTDVLKRGGEEIDVEKASLALADIRLSLGKLEEVRKQHQAAINAIGRASNSATDLVEGVLTGLKRLEALLQN